MARIRLLHSKAAEAAPVLNAICKAGHTVEYDEQFSSELLRQWRKDPPDVFVIDLSRLPSHGKEIAIALRQSPATRRKPVVFCQGAKEKAENLRALLPDALYCGLQDLPAALQEAVETKHVDGALPVPMMDRYGGRTLAQKLGIKAGSRIALLQPPPRFEAVLGKLPENAEFVEADGDVTLCFLHDPDALRQSFSEMRRHAGKTKLWMLWRKKTAKDHCGITEPAVRETGLSVGLVDYKICSVDKNWSGMLFARKRT